MPLIAIACAAYAAGVFTGFVAPAGLGLLVVGITLALGCAALLGRVPFVGRDRATCLLLVAGGAMAASASRARTQRCAEQVGPATLFRATADQPLRSGVVARAEVRAGDCRARATLLVTAGSAEAGDEVIVRGEVERQGERIVVRRAEVRALPPDLSLARARARVGRRIDRLFGDDAPLVRALVIADMSGIPPPERDLYARAGLVHMLSVSGLHVGIVALALDLLASALRLPRTPARVATIGVLGGYILLIGAPAPAVRAGVMLALLLLCRVVQRPTSAWAVIAVGSAVPLVRPDVVSDLGWQLSVAGTIALVAGAALARRTLPAGWRGLRRGVATAAIVSLVATVATAPLVAWSFGRLAVLGPASNLLADPVMGLLQPVLFLAILVPVPAVERLAVDSAHALVVVFELIARGVASVPFAAPRVLPTVLGALAAGVGAVAFVVACVARHPVRPAIVAVAALALLVVEPLVPERRSHTELHMLDVGQGDALAIRTRAGRWVVIDAGRDWASGDAGRSTVVPYLSHRGGDVALFVLSHPHADHVGGAASLIEALTPRRFLDPGFVGTTPSYRAALAEARRQGVAWQRVRPGDSLVVDEVVLHTLAPDSAWAARLDDANLASAVVMARVGAVRMLFTGDAEEPEEEWLLANAPGALAADVLKVGHHGSRTSTTAAFLAAVRPRLALVSVGARNRYGHPSGEVMSRLDSAGAEVLRTDQAGSVVVRTDGRRIHLEARGARWELAARSSHEGAP